jgi:redox-sensitive bicupin YhaK (pirin superfamily)
MSCAMQRGESRTALGLPLDTPTQEPSMDIITPRPSDLGDGFMVRRALPSAARRTVGPFVFLDEMGPAAFEPGRGLDVRPHPHIGLATVSYLFEGEIAHRDSLGTVQTISAGDVNWMAAGRGIVHSERTPREARASGSRLWGLQFWVALPLDQEDSEPAFAHHGVAELPQSERDGARLRVVVGDAYGLHSPVTVPSPMFLVDVVMQPGARLPLDDGHAERAAYVVAGDLHVGQAADPVQAKHLVVFDTGEPAMLRAGDTGLHMVLLGGAALDAPRFLWWNFVASTKERIEAGMARWSAQDYPPVPGETEFIPLPQRKAPPSVNYP